MCATVDEFTKFDFRHHLVVPKRDMRRFRQLETARRTVVAVEDYLPVWALRVPRQRERWLLSGTTYTSGWIVQQIVKIRAAEAAAGSGDIGALVIVDSDICLVRPFEIDHIMSGAKVRFHRDTNPATNRIDPSNPKWVRGACRLLGLSAQAIDGVDYIGPLISWDPMVVERMCRRIESVMGRAWPVAAARQKGEFGFSECVTHGMFVDRCDAAARERLAPTPHSLCHLSLDYDIGSPAGRQDFIRSVRPEHVAVVIQSNLRLPVAQWRALAEEFSRRASTAP